MRIGLFAGFLAFAGAATGRTAGIVANLGAGRTIWLLLAAELAGAVLCLARLFVGKADSSAVPLVDDTQEGNEA